MECSNGGEAPEAAALATWLCGRLADGSMPAGVAATFGAPLIPSGSGSVTRTVNGSHSFTITGYSLAKGMGARKHVASDTFSVVGRVLLPRRLERPRQLAVRLAVHCPRQRGLRRARAFELTMLDMSGKGKHKVHSHFDRSLESGPYPLKHRGSMWGYKRFVWRAALEASDYLKDDTLNVTCTVGVVVSRTEGPRQISIPVPPPQALSCGPMREKLDGKLSVTDMEAPVS
eukprot:SM000372S13696  [mRNA]  locus=s372:43581:45054:+ [translate_table: standard]